jgi:hypothetical protein
MADSINFQITCATLRAEKDTYQKCYGYPWSPALAEAGRNVTFWRNCLRSYKSRGSDPYAALIPSQIAQRGINPNMGPKFYTARLADAWTKLHMTQDRFKELWSMFLEDQIKAAEATTDKDRTAKL